MEKWYPGETEVEHYLSTQWAWHVPISRRQMFGEDEDLAATTAERLSALHQNYFDPQIVVLASGALDLRPVFDSLSALSLGPRALPVAYDPLRWVRREYHEKEFQDQGTFTYYAGAQFELPREYGEEVAVGFIGNYLVNTDHGPLYNWLRKEKGWVYGLYFNNYSSPRDFSWLLRIPLHSREQIDEVRKELLQRMRDALQNRAAIDKEVERRLGAEVFHYQTLASIMSSASLDLQNRERIISEAEFRGYLETCRNTEFLTKVFDKYFSSNEIGEFSAIPKAE
jgi:predicted Zn-dependent peptidase